MTFGFNFGGSASKSWTSGSHQTTTTPIVPDWLNAGTQTLAGQINTLAGQNPYDFVAGSNAWIDEAAGRAAGLGQSNPWLAEAASITHLTADAPIPRMQAASLLDGLDTYMSPYTKDVVDAALADYDYGAGQTRAQQSLDLAGASAFGGSGAALTRSMTDDALTRGRATTSANLRDQAFSRGAALSSEDAARRQAASQANAQFAADVQQRNLAAAAQMANIGNMYWNNARQDVAAIGEVGERYRQIESEQRQAPIDYISALTQAWSGLPSQLFVGQNEAGSSKSKTTTAELKAGFEFG